MNTRKLITLVSLITLLIVTKSAHSASVTVFNNFGPGDSFSINTGSAIGSELDTQQAFKFQPSSSGFLSDLYVAVEAASRPNSSVQFSVHSDNSGLPGAILESFTVPNLADSTIGLFEPQHIIASRSVFLNGGENYWLLAKNPYDSDLIVWRQNSIFATGRRAYRDGATEAWTLDIVQQAVYRIEVSSSAVPIPQAGWLFISGVIFLLGFTKNYHGSI